MDRGMLPSVGTRLVDLLPHYTNRLKDAPKDRITLRHALTMTAGLAWNETAGAFWNNADSVDYVLTRDVVAQPGAEFFYSSGLSHVIAEVNNRASGQSHLAFIQKHLFGPLGIRTATWDQDLSGRHWGGTGLRIRPRDMAKIGQLTLQEGLWEGRRLVSREWIAESTRSQTAGVADAPNYGYQWWIRPQGRYLAHGYNGQYIGVDPEADVVMTMITLSEQSPRPQETYRYYFEELQDLAREAMMPEDRGRLVATAAAGGGDPDGITIEVRRVGGSDGAVTLAYGTRNGSARAGRDFRRTEGELRWEHGDTSTRTVQIPLLPDAAADAARDLRVEFESMSGGIDAPHRMRLEIGPGGRPGNPAGSIEFTGPAFPGHEGDEATISVERRGGTQGDVAVRYRTMPRSAAAADFADVEGRLVWLSGESGTRSVHVPLMADDEIERSELFDLVLSDVSGGADLPEPRAVGVIQDMTAGPGCTDSDGALCLSGGRFPGRSRVAVAARRRARHGFPQASERRERHRDLLLARQRGTGLQAPRRPRHQRPPLGVLRRPFGRRILARRDRHAAGPGRRLPESAGRGLRPRRLEGVRRAGERCKRSLDRRADRRRLVPGRDGRSASGFFSRQSLRPRNSMPARRPL